MRREPVYCIIYNNRGSEWPGVAVLPWSGLLPLVRQAVLRHRRDPRHGFPVRVERVC